jgi:predicted PurR-regulated permease PerM
MPDDTPGTFSPVAENVIAGTSTAGDPLRSIGATRIVRVRTVGLTQGAAFLVVGAVVAAFVLRNAFVAAHRTVGWVVACSIVAMLVDPLVGALQRHIPRWLSIVVVVLGSVAAFVGVVVGLARELLDSLDVLERAAPRAARDLEERYDWAADVDVSARVQSFVDGMHNSVRESTVGEAIGTVPTYLVTGILMLFLLGYGRRYFLGSLKLFDNLERRRTVRQVATTAAARGRKYMLVTVAMALVNGVAFGLLCLAADVPAPLSLGAAVAIMSVLPLIGVIIGGVPALLLAFGSLSWWDGAIVLAGLVVLQTFEALVVRPYLDRRAIRVGPTMPTIVGLLSFELYGIGGAIYGVGLAVLALAALDAIGGVQGDDDNESDILAGAAA